MSWTAGSNQIAVMTSHPHLLKVKALLKDTPCESDTVVACDVSVREQFLNTGQYFTFCILRRGMLYHTLAWTSFLYGHFVSYWPTTVMTGATHEETIAE